MFDPNGSGSVRPVSPESSRLSCAQRRWDLDGNGVVDGADLGLLLAAPS